MNQICEFSVINDNYPVVFNLSSYEILTHVEHETIRRIIKAIAQRNPKSHVKVNIEIKEQI